MSKTILLTRPEQSAGTLKSELEEMGWNILLQPTIEIRPPDSWDSVDETILQLIQHHAFDILVFSSSNGVNFFLERLEQTGRQTDFLSLLLSDHPAIRLAVVGSATNQTLQKRLGCNADFIPKTFSAEGLLEQLTAESLCDNRFLLLRASRGREILRQQLEQAGGIVTEIVVYQSIDIEQPLPEMVELLQSGGIHYITVTSSAIARSLVRMFGERLRHAELISISPITSATLQEIGFSPQYEAETASMNGIAKILKSLKNG